jgi:hypothetical protein
MAWLTHNCGNRAQRETEMNASHPRYFQALSAVVLATVAVSAVASESGSPCTAIQDDAARLACYDNQFGRTAAASPARAEPAPAALAPASAAPASSAAAAPATPSTAAVAATAAVAPAPQPVVNPVEQFGLDPAATQKQAARTAAPPPAQVIDSIESTVTESKRRGTGELVLTLANGQVWTQTQADSKVWIKPGDPVTIKKALLGSYMLVSGHYAFKARRVE